MFYFWKKSAIYFVFYRWRRRFMNMYRATPIAIKTKTTRIIMMTIKTTLVHPGNENFFLK